MSGGHEKPISLTEAYRVMQEHCGIEKGDTVRVLRMPVDGKELGWDHLGYGCTKERKFFIGKTVKISQVGKRDFYFKEDKIILGWPFFCLDLVEKAKPGLPAGVTFTADGLTVGEVYLSTDTIKRNLGL